MPTPVAWFPSFQFNFRQADAQTQVRFVQLRNGDFWVVWTDSKDTGAGSAPGTDLVGQRYNAFGVPQGGEVLLNPGLGSGANERNASLAANTDSSNFVIAYERLDPNGSINLYVERLTSNGSSDGITLIGFDPDFTGGGVGFRNPQVAITSATNGLVVFEQTYANGSTDIFGQFFNPSTGALIGANFRIFDGTVAITNPAVVATTDGRYAVVAQGGSSITGEFINADGTFGAVFRPIETGTPTNPSITALGNGRVVVTWTGNSDILAVAVDASGTMGARNQIAGTAATEGNSRVVANGPNSFVIAWEESSTNRVLLANFTAGGTTIVNSGTSQVLTNVQAVTDLALMAFADGRILLGYDNPIGNAQIFDPRSAPNNPAVYTPTDMQIGTPGSDTFTAATGADIVHGWDGDDLIIDGAGTEAQFFGGNGDDIIRFSFVDPSDGFADGGAGRDTLEYTALAGPTVVNLAAGTATTNGVTQTVINFENFNAPNVSQDINVTGAGEDPLLVGSPTLVTGSGNDRLDLGVGGGGVMQGGAGNDTYQVDANGENVIEFANGGTDTVLTTLAAYTLPTNVEILTYIGTGTATLRDNAGNNTITGGAQNDVIYLTAGGNDTVSGGAGNDGFFFGAAYTSGDVVDGGGGTVDQLGLQGNYNLTLGALTGVEQVVMLAGNDTRFGSQTGTNLSYTLTTIDSNITAGQVLTFQANTLRAGENFTLNASAETNGSVLTFGGLGSETLSGGQQGDGFYFGTGRFNATDVVFGNGGSDQIGLQGDFAGANALTFGDQMVSIEFIVLLSASDTRFGGGNAGQNFSYTITMNDFNVALGEQIIIQANSLRASEVLTFNGATETDGSFRIFGGAGNDRIIGSANADDITGGGGSDRITGGGGADILRGGALNDSFVYNAISESTAAQRDRILDFSTEDLLDLSSLDGNALVGGTQNFTLIGNGAAFTAAGQLRITQNGSVAIVEGETNGDGVADFAIEVTTTGGAVLGAGSFAGLSPAADEIPVADHGDLHYARMYHDLLWSRTVDLDL